MGFKWIEIKVIVDIDGGHNGYGLRSQWIWKVILDMDEGHRRYGWRS